MGATLGILAHALRRINNPWAMLLVIMVLIGILISLYKNAPPLK